MATPRQNKLASKKMADNLGPAPGAPSGANASPRPNPWGRNLANASPMNNSRPPPATNGQGSPASFPPLNAQSPKSSANASPRPTQTPADATMQTLSSLVDTLVNIYTNGGARHQGTIVSTVTEGENPGVNLKDVKNILNMTAPPKTTLFVPMKDILGYNPVTEKTPAMNGSAGAFRTDTDISHIRGAAVAPRERVLEAWQPPQVDGTEPALRGDDVTFGGASNIPWDQFEANEQMFGVKTSFNEELYTTKLDRSRPDFKEKERKAQIIADEILGGVTSNSHMAEERGQKVDDSGLNEEDKYGAVVRSPNAYIPPGARQNQNPSGATPNSTAPAAAGDAKPNSVPPIPTITKQDGDRTIPVVVATDTSPSPPAGTTPQPTGVPGVPGKGAEALMDDFRSFVKNEKNRLTEKRHLIAKTEMDKRKADLLNFSKNFKLNKPIPEDLITIIAKNEDKQKAIKVKSLEDSSSGSARVIGPSITSTTASKKAAAAAAANNIQPSKDGAKTSTHSAGQSSQASVSGPGLLSTSTSKSTTQSAAAKKPAPRMVLQPIPPFNAAKRPTPSGASGAGGLTNSVSASAAEKEKEKEKDIGTSVSAGKGLNINASSFRPTTTAAIKPSPSGSSSASSQKIPEVQPTTSTTPNPFFGTRTLNRKPAHLKDDFNPFKTNGKVAEASTISERWPYTGKRYSHNFPPVPSYIMHGPGPHTSMNMGMGPGMNPNAPNPPIISSPPPGAPAQIPPMAVPTGASPAGTAGAPGGYEEDPNARAAATGYPMYYAAYYPGQMIPGVPPPGYMHPQYLPAMPYPPNMGPPNGPPMYAPPMAGMPPPHFMHPPGAYVQQGPPPPNGANGHAAHGHAGAHGGHGPRPSLPTPVPSHAHVQYPYHQSPQMQHAVPYHPSMLMGGHHPGAGAPPPGAGAGPSHMYDASASASGPPGSNSSNGSSNGVGMTNGNGHPGPGVPAGPGHHGPGGPHHPHHAHSHSHPHPQQQQQHPHHPQHPPQQHHQSPTSMMAGHS